VYVRHFGNITELKQWSTLKADIATIKSFAANKIAITSVTNISGCKLWFSEYQKRLIDLNKRVLDNM